MRMIPPLLLAFLFSAQMSLAQFPFQALTTSVGIDTIVLGMTDNLIYPYGTGVSLVDFNQDGWDDIVIGTGFDLPTLWWINNGDGTFSMIDSPISNTTLQKMPLFGDIDNDGDPDLFVPAFQGRDRLYRNNGNLNFTDISSSAGILAVEEPTNGSSFCDVNADGWLDLYVCNRSDDGLGNFLYMNNGDGTFTEEALQRGVSDGSQLTHQSVFFDYDLDGDQDLFLSNDRLSRNSLYENDGNGYFTNVSNSSNLGFIMDAMNSTAGDINYDGYQELYVTNTPGGTGGVGVGNSRAFLNNGDGTFSEVSTDLGLNLTYYAWSAPWIDFDNDRDEDIFVATYRANNPFVIHQNFFEEYGLQLFLNPWPAGIPDAMQRSFAAAVFDYNEDGRLDIVTPNATPSRVQLWENVSTNSNNWLRFSLEGTRSTRDGVGTRIEVYHDGIHYVRALEMGNCYLSQSFNKLHFGLGDITTVDSVVVKWLSGITETYYDVDANQTIHLVEGAGHPLTMQLTSSPISCPGGEDGEITVMPQDGTAPYTILWNTGDTNFSLTGLASGRYIATITDSDGETGLAFYDLIDPDALAINIASSNETGVDDGIASATVDGGTQPYSYLWSSGHTTADATDLDQGLYSLLVTDDNGCEISAYAAIYDESGGCSAGLVTEVGVGATSARLYWGLVPNLKDMRIGYRVAGTDPWQYQVVHDPLAGLITGLEPATTYEYRVLSRCQDLTKSDWSPIGTFTTLGEDAGPCEAWVPYEILVDDKQAMIYLELRANADAYRIRFREAGTSSWTRITTMFPTIYTGQLESSTQYEYQTATRCSGEWTDWSELDYWETLEPQNLPPIQPEGAPVEIRGAGAVAQVDARVFPNPTSDVLHVVVMHGTADRIRILDLSGKVYKEIQVSGLEQQLQLADLPVGTYFLQAWMGGVLLDTERFIILR